MEQKNVYLQSLAKLGKNKSTFETVIMEVVNRFSSKIEQLQESISRNTQSAETISEKMSTIFKEAQAQLQLVQEQPQQE